MKVLITKKASPEFFALLSRAKVFLDFIEVLEIVPQKIRFAKLSGYGVISSANALNSIHKEQLNLLPERLYIVGQKAASRLREMGYTGSIRVFSRMDELCKELFLQETAAIHYFCGKEHRDVLPGTAKTHPEFPFHSYFCYESRQLFPLLKRRDYDAICLFSPRAAKSLFKHNQFDPDQRFYCIGPITAEAVQGFGYINTHFLAQPEMAMMAQTLLNETYA
ncbi:MAG TPA: hypothetical protein DIW47_10640 [Bacteroidetes bacterium]|nr:hypothetical protein [Bacteroidota bacterium]